jgi:hypothetical protein
MFSLRVDLHPNPVVSFHLVPSTSLPWQPNDNSSKAAIAYLSVGGDLYRHQAGFRAGAEALMESLRQNAVTPDLVVYPLVYSLRHAVELALKMVILGARGLLDQPRDFPDGHRLESLWNTASPLLQQVFSNDQEASKRVTTVIESLRLIDPEGEGFRYPVSTRRRATGNQRVPTIDANLQFLDLGALYDDVSDTLDLLDGAETGIDVYSEYKAEFDAEQAHYQYEIQADYREHAAEMAAEIRAEMEFEHRNDC